MDRRGLLVLLALLALPALPACFYDPQLGAGRIACDDGACPTDLTCGGDDRCYPAGADVTLTASVSGAPGRIVSLPAGIDCPGACSGSFPSGVAVVLVAQGSTQAAFEAWTGCTPDGADPRRCLLVPAADAQAGAAFVVPGGATRWARGFGGAAIDEAYAVATQQWEPGAPTLAFVAGGFSSDTITLAPGLSVTSVAMDDALVFGMAIADGEPSFARSFGAAGYDNVWHAAVTVAGDVTTTGYVEGSVDFGGGLRSVDSGYDTFVATYDPTGAWLWDRVFPCGGELEDEGNSIATDNNGDVYVTGVFAGTCDFGDGTVRNGLSSAPFVVALDGATGVTRWARHFPVVAGGSGEGLRLAVSNTGDVTVVGSFRKTLEADAAPLLVLTSANDLEDVFVIKLNGADGETIWAERFGGDGSDWANSVAVDDNGASYVTGRFQETADFGQGERTSNGLSDVFLLKLSVAGQPSWDVTFGGTGDDDGYAVAIDFLNGDQVLLGGGFNGSVDFGGDFLVESAGGQDAFVARYTGAGGEPLWVRPLGGPEDDVAYDVTVVPSTTHEILVTGSFRQSVDFGVEAITSNGEEDIFVVSLEP